MAKVIMPFVEKHCVICHGTEKPKAGLSLRAFKDGDEKETPLNNLWLSMLERVDVRVRFLSDSSGQRGLDG